SPRRSVKSTPSRARTPGKTLLTFRAWSNGWSQEFLITLKISTGQWRYSKRVESPLRAHRAADGERHTHAAVPGRQIAALGRFTHRFPIATIRTDGELKAIAAPGRQAQINARPDDVVHFGDGLVLVVLAPPHQSLAFANRHAERVGRIAKGGQAGEGAQFQTARIDHCGGFVIARRDRARGNGARRVTGMVARRPEHELGPR